ncbi:hypothetical protein CG736_23850 [Kitasatospora sp. CB02891]|nr:hypothetical protein CG736_23850 [Kitasatospora sp. CB02891]
MDPGEFSRPSGAVPDGRGPGGVHGPTGAGSGRAGPGGAVRPSGGRSGPAGGHRGTRRPSRSRGRSGGGPGGSAHRPTGVGVSPGRRPRPWTAGCRAPAAPARTPTARRCWTRTTRPADGPGPRRRRSGRRSGRRRG